MVSEWEGELIQWIVVLFIMGFITDFSNVDVQNIHERIHRKMNWWKSPRTFDKSSWYKSKEMNFSFYIVCFYSNGRKSNFTLKQIEISSAALKFKMNSFFKCE